MGSSWWLDPIPETLRSQALEAISQRDAVSLLCCASNTDGLSLVYMNVFRLKELGIYETALLDAFTATRTNNSRWPLEDLNHLFNLADRALLRAAGDPLPGSEPFTLYRGVAGFGRRRRVRGLCWTSSFERAIWFAERWGLAHPTVNMITVPESRVRAYVNDREEQEFILNLLESDVLTRVWPVISEKERKAKKKA